MLRNNTYVKISGELLPYPAEIVKDLKLKRNARKGVKWVRSVVVSGFDSDDFARNLITVMLKSYGVKKPRFIKC